MRVIVFFILGILLIQGCKNKKQEPLFRLLSPDETGIHFSNDLNEKQLNIIEYLYYYNGGGVAVGDFDNDGLPDIYFTSNEGPNKLYRNLGDLKFEDITVSAGVAGTGDWTTGVTLVDINNDGFLDIYVCQVSGYKGTKGKNQLFVNNGDLTFTERADEYGLDFEGFSTQAVFFDYDLDGDLDMFLLNHSVHTFRSYGSAEMRLDVDSTAGDRLYKNLKNEGGQGFIDVTEEAGIYSTHIGYGLGVGVSDVNLDGYPDLYISNDFHENDYLYLNNGDGTFREVLETYIGHTSRYSMGNDIADINGDLWPDIITLDMLPDDPGILMKSAAEDLQEVHDIKKGFGYGPQYVRNAVQFNQGEFFIDAARMSGIFATDWSWAPLICDLDNDGMMDVFISNGIYKRPNDLDYIEFTADMAHYQANTRAPQDSINRELIRKMPTLKIPNYAFTYVGDYRFEDKTDVWGLAHPSYSSGAVYADLDNDGDLDLIINNVNQEAFIYENTSEKKEGSNYLKVNLKSDSNSFGIGARVRVFVGGKIMDREIFLSRGFQSSISPEAHFGLGNAGIVDSLIIYWRGHKSQILYDILPNQVLVIIEPDSLEPRPLIIFEKGVKGGLEKHGGTIDYKHREDDYLDYKSEPLIPYLMSREGPALAVGDITGDGLEDFFIGGAHGQPGSIFIQTGDGGFEKSGPNEISLDSLYEDVDAVFFDFDGDGALDLYVVSGGNRYPPGHFLYEDRLYLNDGSGNFARVKSGVKYSGTNGSCVRLSGVQINGKTHIFIGSRSVPGSYGMIPKSYILSADGRGKIEVIQEIEPGMVTDAAWADLDDDGIEELIIVGDWMPVLVFEWKSGKYVMKNIDALKDTEGWWRAIKAEDINGDGYPDLILGNVGENLKFSPSSEEPLELYLGDFDGNGQLDPVMFYYLMGRKIPFHAKPLLIKQMPYLNKRFRTYRDFSNYDGPQDLLGKERILNAKKFKVNTFETMVLVNDGKGGFSKVALPFDAQLSQINDLLIYDINNDGRKDILIAGNFFANSVDLGKADAMSFYQLVQDEAGNFSGLELRDGSNFNKEFGKVKMVNGKSQRFILLAENNGLVHIYSFPINYN